MKKWFITLFIVAALSSSVKAQSDGGPAEPPFDSISFNHRFSELIRSSDSTAFKAITYKGQHNRKIRNDVADRTYIFTVDFEDGLTTEMQVHSKFGSSENAEIEANRLAIVIGRIPTILRLHLKRVVISKGNDYTVANGRGSIFTSNGDGEYLRRLNLLEETMMHEGVHTLFDALHGRSSLNKELRTLYDSLHVEKRNWAEATKEDPAFVCTYGRDDGSWEDMAESIVAYLAIRYRLDRISERDASLIREAIPNRISFFDSLNTEGLWCPVIADDCLRAADEQHAAVAVAQESADKTKKMNNDSGGIQVHW